MKTELVNLSQIELNAANPRIIKNDKFEKLINSLLALPKMLDLSSWITRWLRSEGTCVTGRCQP